MAILIKRGPGRYSCTIGWDRRTDTFELGQWIKQKIDHDAADLSPDGRHFVYYVNTQRWGREHSVYRAISIAPWLKAMTFWGSKPRTSGPGVGMFFRDADGTVKLRASEHHPAEWDHVGIKVVGEYPNIPPWNSMVKDSYLFIRLQRDGWIPTTPWEKLRNPERGGRGSEHRIIFEKALPHRWTLRQTHWCSPIDQENRGVSWESFEIVSPDGKIQPQPDWEWAEFDPVRNRIVWTADCILFCAGIYRDGPGTANLLLNTTDLRFEPRKAPY